MYSVKEIYYTIQGEGYHTGRAAVFCRFSGCNLWTGREEDRHKAICKFCDTNFWGTDGLNGGKYSKEELVNLLFSLFPQDIDDRFIVFTGGEPALQITHELVDALHELDIEVAIETNGTKQLPENIDWICMSPKANTDIVIKKGHEIKIVIPQEGVVPEDFQDYDFDHKYLQPMESEAWEENIFHTIQYVKSHPTWKLSMQTHKYLGIR